MLDFTMYNMRTNSETSFVADTIKYVNGTFFITSEEFGNVRVKPTSENRVCITQLEEREVCE